MAAGLAEAGGSTVGPDPDGPGLVCGRRHRRPACGRWTNVTCAGTTLVTTVRVDTQADGTSVRTPTGDVAIRGRIYAKWRALEAVNTPDGDDAQAHLEHPLGGQTPVPEGHGGGAVQLFRRGMIVERADGRTFAVYGAIYDHYVKIGGTASAMGQPTSDEQDAPGNGRVSHFQNGDIYWRADLGALEVRGAARDRYATGGDPFARSWLDRGVAAIRRRIARVLFPSR
jgi:uncharacterized protein with LGFP repeats